MNHIEAVRAALKATAPVVAIPVEGRVPVCIKARLLKGALKGVTIHSVELLRNGWLKVTGIAQGSVRTSCSFAPIERWKALMEIRDWTIKEREKRIRVINQGVLSAQTRRELKKKEIESEADQVLRDALKQEARIMAEARKHCNPAMSPVDDERRASILGEYAAFRGQRTNRKCGAVVRWKLAKLKEEIEKITRQEGPRRHKKTVLRNKKDGVLYAVLLHRKRELVKQFESLYPPVLGPYEWWTESWIAKRPKDQTIRPDGWWRGWGESHDRYDRNVLAKELKEARANIRALAPPVDEETVPEQIAA